MTPHYNTYTYTPLDITSYLKIHITMQCGLPKWYRNRKWVTLVSISAVKRRSNGLSVQRVGIRNTHTHTWDRLFGIDNKRNIILGRSHDQSLI